MSIDQHLMLEPRQLNDLDQRILDELADDRASPGYLSEQLGEDSSYINQRLKRLGEHGHVEKLARGLWELVDDPRGEPTPALEDVLNGIATAVEYCESVGMDSEAAELGELYQRIGENAPETDWERSNG